MRLHVSRYHHHHAMIPVPPSARVNTFVREALQQHCRAFDHDIANS